MKTKLLLLLCVVLSGCDRKVAEYNDGSKVPFSSVTKYTYSGHDYIKFDRARQAGVVHDPDCGCGGAR